VLLNRLEERPHSGQRGPEIGGNKHQRDEEGAVGYTSAGGHVGLDSHRQQTGLSLIHASKTAICRRMLTLSRLRETHRLRLMICSRLQPELICLYERATEGYEGQ
jgi:hypothetical protein